MPDSRVSLSTTLAAVWLLVTVLSYGWSDLQAEEPPSSAQTAPEMASAEESEIDFSRFPANALKEITLDVGTSLFDRLPTTLQDLKELEVATTKLVPDYQAVTVGIQVGDGQGSGVVISPQGHILTAAHVVGEVGNQVTIVFPDGRRHLARVAGVNVGIDSALVRLEGKGPYPYVPMAQNHFAIPGRWVIAIGHPNGYASNRLPVVRLGRVIQCTDKTVQTDCSLVGGDSGGPLFDLNGRVVGIHSRIGINNSINFHVPVQVYLKDWDELNAGYKPDETQEAPPRQKAYLGLRGRDAVGRGSQITEVTPNGPAAQAGLQRGDIITQCGEEPIKNFGDLVAALKTKQPEEEISVKIIRDGKTQEVTVVLGGTEI